MNIDSPTPSQIPALRALWKQAFGDSDAFLDCFFSSAYAPERCRCLSIEDIPVSMLYWFDCTWQSKKLAYFYAVATDKTYQGHGFCQQLMNDTHRHLNDLGYAGAVLSPGSTSLFSFYERLGYHSFGPIDLFTCTAGSTPIPIKTCTTDQYAALRRQYLPPNSILQEDITLQFLATQAQFYAGDDFLLCCYLEAGNLRAQEFLGNPAAAPGILNALQIQTGTFRTPGATTPLAMFCPFSPIAEHPSYLGLPLD